MEHISVLFTGLQSVCLTGSRIGGCHGYYTKSMALFAHLVFCMSNVKLKGSNFNQTFPFNSTSDAKSSGYISHMKFGMSSLKYQILNVKF